MLNSISNISSNAHLHNHFHLYAIGIYVVLYEQSKSFWKQNSSECSLYSREVMDVRQPGKYQSRAELNNSNITI